MYYQSNLATVLIFLFFVLFVLGLSFVLGRKAKSAKGYYAAHGQIGWFVNGVAFAGDYLSAASFLGICGMIAFYGYDGFLYSIGYLAGWIVALFVIAEPIKRLGKFTFADALDSRFNSRGIKLTVAISTLVVSTFYLIPQMVGAGTLIQPLLGWRYSAGVLLVGVTVTLIVVTAGMVSTTWVQFIKGSLLVVFCFVLTVMILQRGLTASGSLARTITINPKATTQPYANKPYVRVTNADGTTTTTLWRVMSSTRLNRGRGAAATGPDAPYQARVVPVQVLTVTPDGRRLVNGKPQGPDNDLKPVGTVAAMADLVKSTGPVGPARFLRTFQRASIVTWTSESVSEPDGSKSTIYFPLEKLGADLLTPGASPTFAGVRSTEIKKKLDFLSLMLALFCGTASLPHILIRYYTVKDGAAARKSTVVGIASIGLFYVLTLFLGLGAMTSGSLDPTNNTMAAPLLARSFSNPLFAIISAVAFTTVLGTVSGLIMAGSGAVAHDLMENFFRTPMNDYQKVLYGKIAAGCIGAVAMLLGIAFEHMNPTFLVGWAFNIAASANLPALIMLLFWRGTTKRGITAAVTVGMIASLAWILLSPQCYKDVYGLDPARSIIPFSQPGLITIPLGFIVLVAVSLVTRPKRDPELIPQPEPSGVT